MIRIDSRSALRGKLAHPPFEQWPGVVRAGAGLRMELQRPGAQLRERETLDGSVVERDVRHLPRLRGVDAEAVILSGHEHAAALALEHRVVRAAVAERQLRRREPRRTPEQLVAETDPEQRHAADELADDGALGLERLRVAGAVREQHAVVAC